MQNVKGERVSRGCVHPPCPSPPPSGCPSTPQVALTPTAGGLTVQLTVMYPGTREDTVQYSISTSPLPLSRRQTGQQPLPVTDLITPTSGSAEVALGPGTYSVTVTVTNQHGSTTSVPQQVTIVGWLLRSTASPHLVLLCCSTCTLCLQYLLQFRFSCIVWLARMSLLAQWMGWSSMPDYPIHGWWCQCVCVTDLEKVHSTAVVGFEGPWLTSTGNGWPCVVKLLLLLQPKHGQCGEATPNCGLPFCWHGNVVVYVFIQ